MRKGVGAGRTVFTELDTAGAGKIPLLGKGGVAAPSSKWPLPLKGADGVVRSSKCLF